MGIKFLSLLLVGVLSAVGCSGQVELTNSSSDNDFALSHIVVNGTAVANGSSELLVVIQLKNSNGRPIKQFRPTYSIVSGAGVTGSQCTPSDTNGISTCLLKSTHSGTKRFAVTNLTKVTLEQDVLFLTTSAGSFLSTITPAATNTQSSASGATLRGNLGTLESDLVKTSASGWKIFGGPQGDALSVR